MAQKTYLATKQRLWLQRSQMFIDIGYEGRPRSSGAQCFWGNVARAYVSLLRSEEKCWTLGVHKHFVPPGRGTFVYFVDRFYYLAAADFSASFIARRHSAQIPMMRNKCWVT